MEVKKNFIFSKVKLFLNNLDPEIVKQAILTSKWWLNGTLEVFWFNFFSALEEIGVDTIDTLIISFPDKIFIHDELPNDLIIPIWSVVQGFIDTKQIVNAGLADFNAKYLEQFFNLVSDRNVSVKIHDQQHNSI